MYNDTIGLYLWSYHISVHVLQKTLRAKSCLYFKMNWEGKKLMKNKKISAKTSDLKNSSGLLITLKTYSLCYLIVCASKYIRFSQACVSPFPVMLGLLITTLYSAVELKLLISYLTHTAFASSLYVSHRTFHILEHVSLLLQGFFIVF